MTGVETLQTHPPLRAPPIRRRRQHDRRHGWSCRCCCCCCHHHHRRPLGVVHVLRCAECRGQRCDAPSTAAARPAATVCERLARASQGAPPLRCHGTAMASLGSAPTVAAARGEAEPSPRRSTSSSSWTPTPPRAAPHAQPLTELHLTLARRSHTSSGWPRAASRRSRCATRREAPSAASRVAHCQS